MATHAKTAKKPLLKPVLKPINTLVKPLQQAGVATPPVIQRVWQWVADNGPHGANQTADALKLERNNTSSTLGILCDRGMMTRATEVRLGKSVLIYTANPKMKTYELWPVSKEAKARKAATSKLREEARNPKSAEIFTIAGTAHLPKPEDTALVEVQAVEVQATEAKEVHILDRLSVREAYALYLELRTMFNPVALTDAGKA